MQQQIIEGLSRLFSEIGIHEPMVGTVVGTFLFLFGELMLLFLLISFFVGLLQSYISRDKIQAALTTKYRFLNSVLGAVLGSVTPFCSCSTIPLLVGLRKSRAPFAGMVSFLLTSPILNPMILIIFFGFFGLIPTLLYAGIALGFAIVGGYVLDRLGFARYLKDDAIANYDESTACGCGTADTEAQVSRSNREEPCACADAPLLAAASASCCPAPPIPQTQTVTAACCGAASVPDDGAAACCASLDAHEGEGGCCDGDALSYREGQGSFVQRHTAVWRDAWLEAWSQFRKLLVYLLIGAGIGSFIYGFVPAEFLVEVAGAQNPFAVPLAAVLGVPMYIRTEAVLPLANLLIGQGVGLGTMVALIIGGAGASIPEVSLLSTLFKKQFIITFLLCIFTVAVIAGYAFNILL